MLGYFPLPLPADHPSNNDYLSDTSPFWPSLFPMAGGEWFTGEVWLFSLVISEVSSSRKESRKG